MGCKDTIIHFIKRFRLLLGLVTGIFLFNVLFYFIFVRPVSIDRDGQQRMYGEMRKVLSGRDTQEQRYLQAGKDMETFMSRLLKKEDEIKIIEEMVILSQRTNLTLKNAHYSRKPIKEEELWAYGMDLPFTGQYKDIKDFLAEIEKSPSVLCIEQFKITRSKDGPLELSLTLATYLR
ncbi:MAG: type 4a pilus biogenesis protein PilO [Thermodesulfobacteriota bacterium]